MLKFTSGLLVALVGLLSQGIAPIAFAEKQDIEIPVMIGIGMGLGTLDTNTPVTGDGQNIYTLKLKTVGTVESETMEKIKDKLPEDIPEWLKTGGKSYDPGYLPDAIYFTDSSEGDAKVYGFNYGPSLGVSAGGMLSVGGRLGLSLTYMYMESPYFNDNHFFSVGANGQYYVLLKPIKYLHLEVGRVHHWNISNELDNGQSLSDLTETYAMLHFRFPYTVNTKL